MRDGDPAPLPAAQAPCGSRGPHACHPPQQPPCGRGQGLQETQAAAAAATAAGGAAPVLARTDEAVGNRGKAELVDDAGHARLS